jgi:hypothetical protein
MSNKTIPLNAPIEFLNFEAINPLISQCTVKVMYTGTNRNQSFISKEVAEKMAKTLPNTPIVGEWNPREKDFTGHGHDFTSDEEGNIIASKKTFPVGVVPADTKIWWEDFVDPDGVERTYMCCYGYLWTGRYPESKKIIQDGKNNQSMELDPNTIQGEWTKIDKKGPEYFVIQEANFSALCVLGEKVEPCFEGASFIPLNFSLVKDEDFNSEMQELLFELDQALVGYKDKSITNFPNNGDNQEISMRNSQWKTFDAKFAANLKENHPDIWRLGGNIRGNSQYRKLTSALGKSADQLNGTQKNAIELREAWVARHHKDFRIAGVIAQIKWLAVGSRGEKYMKDLVKEEIKKREERKKKMNHSLYSQASDLTDKFLAAIKKLDALANKFDEGQDSESTDALDSIILELHEVLDSMSREDVPIQSDADLSNLESYKKKEEENLEALDNKELEATLNESQEAQDEAVDKEEVTQAEVGDPEVQMEESTDEEAKETPEEDAKEDESAETEMAQTPENKSADEKVASLIADIQKALEELKKAQGADEASESAYADEEMAAEPEKAAVIGKTQNAEESSEYGELLEKMGYIVMENEELKMELDGLRKFKADVDQKDKETMMEKFSNLDAGFLAEVKTQLHSFSLEQLEAKLAIEAVRSGVSVKSESVTSYSAESFVSEQPSWIIALEKSKK